MKNLEGTLGIGTPSYYCESPSSGSRSSTRPPLVAHVVLALSFILFAYLLAPLYASTALFSARTTTQASGLQATSVELGKRNINKPINNLRTHTIVQRNVVRDGTFVQQSSTTPLPLWQWCLPPVVTLGALISLLRPRLCKASTSRRGMAMAAAAGQARDDDILPDGVMDAVARASKATALAIKEGTQFCIAEVELDNMYDIVSGPQFTEPGSAERWLKMNHDFLELLVNEVQAKVVAVFPDKMVASMVAAAHSSAPYISTTIAAAKAKRAFAKGASIVVFVAPDAEHMGAALGLAATLPAQVGAVLFNPRVGDFNLKRGQSSGGPFDKFVVTYSMRYIRGTGAIFRCYPDPWKVFSDDPDVPGRYRLVTTLDRRPAIWELDYIMSTVKDGQTSAVLEVEDEVEGSSVVGYSMLYFLSAAPFLIVAGVTALLFINSLK